MNVWSEVNMNIVNKLFLRQDLPWSVLVESRTHQRGWRVMTWQRAAQYGSKVKEFISSVFSCYQKGIVELKRGLWSANSSKTNGDEFLRNRNRLLLIFSPRKWIVCAARTCCKRQLSLKSHRGGKVQKSRAKYSHSGNEGSVLIH